MTNGHIDGTRLTFTVNNDADSSLKLALVLANGHLQGEATSNKGVAGGKLTIKVDAMRRIKVDATRRIKVDATRRK